ncbi:MAG TPA: glycosyltransferase family 39 protein [Anaeromyxobacteraceae bacterium]|nr:glycosyltransferase family 39 protein [Anaeromyxobacteraceae bacterium]
MRRDSVRALLEPRTAFRVAAAALLATRALHLLGPLDEPHAWRQAETGAAALNFHRFGIDLLRPSVNWLGGHRLHAFEFPLTEAISALGYAAVGPSVVVDRTVNLAFFAASALFLHLIVVRAAGLARARVATLMYLAAPLGLFYSRAVHVDFTAVALAHAMAWLWMKAADDHHRIGWTAGAVAGALAFLVKAPYAFYLYLPVGAYVLPRLGRRAAPYAAAAAAFPVVAFAIWRVHADRLNASAPDWTVIPGYAPGASMASWYFGSWTQRVDPGAWLDVARGSASGALAWVGLAPFAVGLLARRRHGETLAVERAWLLGLLAYLLVFFNLTFRHDYYRLPLLAGLAVVAARGLLRMADVAAERPGTARRVVVGASLAVMGVASITVAETSYYAPIAPEYLRAGAFVRSATPADALVVFAKRGLDWNDPLFLFLAQRNGWNAEATAIGPALIDTLTRAGATYLAVAAGDASPYAVELVRRNPAGVFWDVGSDRPTLMLARLPAVVETAAQPPR